MKTIIYLLILFVPTLMYAQQPGTLDKNFGDTGIVLNKNFEGIINVIALQSDAKIIAAGGGGTIESPFLLVRYNIDGTIDSSFGDNGVTGTTELSLVFGMAVEKDDAIIALGHTAKDIKLAKYKKDGGLDESFGNAGTVITNVEGNDVPVEVLIQPDGKILVGGYSINAENQPREGFLIRYLPDGSLDQNFGAKGEVIFEGRNEYEPVAQVDAIALQNNGQILVSVGLTSATIYRFNNDGSRDTNFGNNGFAVFQSSDEKVKGFSAYSLAIQTDGKIIGGGEALKRDLNGNSYTAAARVNVDGSIDSSFGTNGIVHILFNKDFSKATKVLLQADNKIILSGSAHDQFTTYLYPALTRLKTDGSTDSTFGDNGQTKTFTDGLAESTDALFQKDGKIVLGGNTFIGDFTGKEYFLLSRYNNDGSKKQILITKIKRWLQHHSGFTWDNNNNVSSYVVQRSYDGIHFSSIARINARNSSNAYADPSPLSGNNYYRLQTTSTDGAVNYSNILAVSNQSSVISISPNPAKNNLRIQGLIPSQKSKLTVVDFSGNVKQQAVANNTSYNLNIATLTRGNYLLKIEMNGEVVTKKFVKE